MDGKQLEIDWLRDHRQVEVTASGLDPRVATILERLNKDNEALKNEPGKNLKKNLVGLTKEMFDFFQTADAPYEAALLVIDRKTRPGR